MSQKSLAGNFESTAQRMLEVLDKAAAELSKNVTHSVEQLSVYNFGLQKSLTDQLRQVAEKLQSFTEARTDDLEKCKTDLVTQMDEFGQSEIDTVVATGQAVRQSLSSYTQQALDKITSEVEQQLQQLRTLLDEPEQDINTRASDAVSAIREVSESGLATIEQTGGTAESALTERVQEFECELEQIVSEWKENIQSKVEASQNGFAESAAKIIEELNSVFDNAVNELQTQAQSGSDLSFKCVEEGKERAGNTFADWKTQIDELSDTFKRTVESGKDNMIEGESNEIDQKMAQAKEEISSVAAEAREKIRNSHKSFQQSLNKLEQDYERRMQLLMSAFETTVSETLRRSNTAAAMEQRAANDMLEGLAAHLNTRGDEMLRAIRRMTEQLEIEYSKSWQGMESRIEHIKDSTLETFMKQVQSMKSESEKATRAFQQELREMEAHLAEIEEAGKAAAVTVMAYRSALLSLGGE